MVCERMGWTFSYFDTLDIDDLQSLLQVWDGMKHLRGLSL